MQIVLYENCKTKHSLKMKQFLKFFKNIFVLFVVFNNLSTFFASFRFLKSVERMVKNFTKMVILKNQ